MPNVVQEAGAYGLPVAATPVGDVPLWVQPGTTGFLFPVGDAQALAQVLARVLEEPALLPRLSQGMLARVGAQDPLEGLARTRAIYKEIACQKGRLG
jgi:glycosyltransferase involved in cell wall biosynthesis